MPRPPDPPPRLQLRLLGGADLRDAEGRELREVVRQPKRLALLAYLALSGGTRFFRRDSLLALFWPELDDHHARAALRRTLHFLRSHLGDDVLVSRGDEVAVPPEQVRCDATAFLDALAGGDAKGALDLYRGDLLEGFFVPSAPGFERWLDERRAHLRRAAAAAAWQLAEEEEAAGHAVAAADWGRRAAALAPDDEVALRRLLGLFDRLGDHAAAVQVYDEFARRLSEEFALSPAPETRALIEGLRTRAAAALPLDAGAPAVSNPNLIAVLPFAVRAEPALGYLREGLVDLLSTKLDGAGDVRTVDPHALLTQVSTAGPEDLDPVRARALAQRFGAGAVLLGSVIESGSALVVRATLFDTDGIGELRVDAEAADERGLSGVVDELVRQLLAKRSTSHGGHLGRLGVMTTESLPALKAYLAGERAFRQGRYLDAIEDYARAVGGDPEFALARYRLAAARAAAGRLDEARRDAAAATQARRLTPHARLLLTAQAAWMEGDLTAAERRYLAVIDERPDDVEAWFGMARVLFYGNPLRGRSATDARAALEHTRRLDPRHAGAVAMAVRVAALEGRTKDITDGVDRYMSLSPGGDEALALEAIRAAAERDERAYEVWLSRLAVARPTALTASLLDLSLAATDLALAGRVLARVATLAPAAALGAIPTILGAHLATARGDPHAAAELLAEAERVDPGTALEHRAWLGLVADEDPSADAIASLQEALETWEPHAETTSVARFSGGLGVIRAPARLSLLGLAAVVRDDARGADRHAAACGALQVPEWATGLPSALAAGVRARLALRRGEPAAALELLEGIRLGPWIHRAASSPFCALAAERLARAEALTALRRPTEAREWLIGIGQRSAFEIACRPRAQHLLALHAGA